MTENNKHLIESSKSKIMLGENELAFASQALDFYFANKDDCPLCKPHFVNIYLEHLKAVIVEMEEDSLMGDGYIISVGDDNKEASKTVDKLMKIKKKLQTIYDFIYYKGV